MAQGIFDDPLAGKDGPYVKTSDLTSFEHFQAPNRPKQLDLISRFCIAAAPCSIAMFHTAPEFNADTRVSF